MKFDRTFGSLAGRHWALAEESAPAVHGQALAGTVVATVGTATITVGGIVTAITSTSCTIGFTMLKRRLA